MRKRYFLLTALVCAAVTTGCNNGNEPDPVIVPEPEFKLTETELNTEASGTICSVPYTIENPSEDGKINVSGNTDWATLKDITTENIEIKVEANPTEESRKAEITVTYSYTYNKASKSQVKTLTITQDGKEPEPVPDPDPELSVSADIPEFACEGAKDYEFVYELKNPVSGVKVEASSDVDWAGNIRILEDEKAVRFDVAENTAYEKREGKIILSYTYSINGNEPATI
ncbi:MAG: BACON domain-containing protein, partial [Candidatus Cryptobacteroides sp.]